MRGMCPSPVARRRRAGFRCGEDEVGLNFVAKGGTGSGIRREYENKRIGDNGDGPHEKP